MQTEDVRSAKRARACWRVVAIWSLLVATLISVALLHVRAVYPGNSATFWMVAALVDITPNYAGDDAGFSGGAAFKDEKWAVYEDGGLHGTWMYRVPIEDAFADFNNVVAAAEARAADVENDHYSTEGYRRWFALDEAERTPESLLECVNEAELEYWVREKNVAIDALNVEEETRLDDRWDRIDWFWANIFFEWLYLSGLLLFLIWPLYNRMRRFALHVTCMPMLIMLPAYLGYATYGLPNSYHPGTSLVYRWLLHLVGRLGPGMNAADVWIIEHTPQILADTSGPYGGTFFMIEGCSFGPTGAILVGLTAGATVRAAMWVYARYGGGNGLADVAASA